MSECKNIILLVAEMNRPGGTERVVANLANNFTAHGYHVKIYSVNTKSGDSFYPLDPAVALLHLDVYLEPNVFIRSSIGFYNTVRKIKQTLQLESAPAILLATDPITCFAISRIKKSLPQHRYIACEHMGLAIAKWHSRTARMLFYNSLDAIVFLTKRDRDALAGMRRQWPPLYVIPNELSFWPPEPSDNTYHILLAVGKYDHQKRFDVLLDIISPVLKRHKDWQLQLVGQGPLENKLQELITQLQLSGQVLLIPPTQQIQQIYQKASVYLMTSAYEGFPMVLLEAKSFGLPIVAYDCPSGPGEIIQNKKDGFLIAMEDAKSFQDSVERLIKDLSLRQQMGRLARENVSQYNSLSIFERWQALFNTLL